MKFSKKFCRTVCRSIASQIRREIGRTVRSPVTHSRDMWLRTVGLRSNVSRVAGSMRVFLGHLAIELEGFSKVSYHWDFLCFLLCFFVSGMLLALRFLYYVILDLHEVFACPVEDCMLPPNSHSAQLWWKTDEVGQKAKLVCSLWILWQLLKKISEIKGKRSRTKSDSPYLLRCLSRWSDLSKWEKTARSACPSTAAKLKIIYSMGPKAMRGRCVALSYQTLSSVQSFFYESYFPLTRSSVWEQDLCSKIILKTI